MGPLQQSTLPITIQEIAAITGGHVFGVASIGVTDVTHDSRRAKQGSLFVAVRGELFDAHKFVPQVIEQGAAGVLSELDPPEEWSSDLTLGGRNREVCSWRCAASCSMPTSLCRR